MKRNQPRTILKQILTILVDIKSNWYLQLMDHQGRASPNHNHVWWRKRLSTWAQWVMSSQSECAHYYFFQLSINAVNWFLLLHRNYIQKLLVLYFYSVLIDYVMGTSIKDARTVFLPPCPCLSRFCRPLSPCPRWYNYLDFWKHWTYSTAPS